MNMMTNVIYLTIHHTENIVLKQVKEKKFMPKDNAKDAEDVLMERDRAYLRKQRRRKIKQRKEMIKNTENDFFKEHYVVPYMEDSENKNHKTDLHLDSVYGDKDGYLSKSHHGMLGMGGRARKTNTRKGHASYRHKGSYGKADEYSPHDQKQIDAMEHDMKELNEVKVENNENQENV
jgi:hypothetical protein